MSPCPATQTTRPPCTRIDIGHPYKRPFDNVLLVCNYKHRSPTRCRQNPETAAFSRLIAYARTGDPDAIRRSKQVGCHRSATNRFPVAHRTTGCGRATLGTDVISERGNASNWTVVAPDGWPQREWSKRNCWTARYGVKVTTVRGAPRAQPVWLPPGDGGLVLLVAGIVAAAPDRTLQQIAAQLEAMQVMAPSAAGGHPSSVKDLLMRAQRVGLARTVPAQVNQSRRLNTRTRHPLLCPPGARSKLIEWRSKAQ
jgi:hypothetical protein